MRRRGQRLGIVAALAAGAATLPGLAGQLALYPALGVFPGLALSEGFLGSASATVRVSVGIALAPIVSAIVGLGLVAAGLTPRGAATIVAGIGSLAWALLVPRAKPSPTPSALAAPGDRRLWAWCLGLSAAVTIPNLFNRWNPVKSDAWVHGALVWEILTRGIPPQDPRFAGLPLNFVWIFNFFVALLTSVRQQNPFYFMVVFNVVNVAVYTGLAYAIGWVVWRERRAALGSALLVVLGLNAGAWILWPLRGIYGVLGEVRGWEAIRSAYGPLQLDNWRVLYTLNAPLSHMVSFLDKFLIGTSLSYAWVLMLVFLWAGLTWLETEKPSLLAIGTLSAIGMLLFHGVVGLSVVPVAIGTFGLAWLLRIRVRWLPPMRTLFGYAAAAGLGFALALPYTWSISRGWGAASSGVRQSFFHLDYVMPWTIATSSAVALALAWSPARRLLREKRGLGAVLVLYAIAIGLFAIVVDLPETNESKFAFEVFVPIAILGGAAFLPWIDRMIRGRGRIATGAVVVLLFLLPPALTLIAFSIDPIQHTTPELHVGPSESQLYTWVERETPPNAVLVDAKFRDLGMVFSRRQLYLGSSAGPGKAAFPLVAIRERRAVLADLYGPASDLDRDAEALDRLGRPVYVLYRAADFGAAPDGKGTPGSRLAARPDLFARVYDRKGFVVYHRVRPMTARSSTLGDLPR